MISIILIFGTIVFGVGFSSFPNETFGDFTWEDNDYALFPLENFTENFLRKISSVDDENERIMGGFIAEPNQFPYVVGMVLWNPDETSWCSGSIISRSFILTAAHCLERAPMVSIIFGAHDQRNTTEVGRVRREVTKENFIIHELWNQRTLDADIALIHLTPKLKLTAQVQYITIPYGRYETHYFQNYEATVCGWGRYDRSCRLRSYYLRYYNARVLHNTECERHYLYYVRLNHICVDGKQMKVGCKGDSGGPLQISIRDGTPMLVGILSFSKCGHYGNPTVFTRITQFLPWIRKHTNITGKGIKKKILP